jgi:hypothetical protein
MTGTMRGALLLACPDAPSGLRRSNPPFEEITSPAEVRLAMTFDICGSLGISVVAQYIWRFGVSRIGNPTYIWRCSTLIPREPHLLFWFLGWKYIRQLKFKARWLLVVIITAHDSLFLLAIGF